MIDDLAPLTRKLPAPIRYPLAFFLAFVLPAPVYSQAIKLA